ncbi:uncharacterized protein P884DRAFT_303192 [Thermothelomyces heterothallicus CBS 202.75]|uniref:uncharacterized protein n=1 Tax=Thermothelomyces heterothallicus CBS 202.75 TaxID=1149848 RepID=UPI0037442E49
MSIHATKSAWAWLGNKCLTATAGAPSCLKPALEALEGRAIFILFVISGGDGNDTPTVTLADDVNNKKNEEEEE